MVSNTLIHGIVRWLLAYKASLTAGQLLQLLIHASVQARVHLLHSLAEPCVAFSNQLLAYLSKPLLHHTIPTGKVISVRQDS